MTTVHWPNARLSGVNLSGRINLHRAEFPDADLSRANLRGARLGYADLRGANLTGADLRGTRLFGANLTGARLTGALADERTIWPDGFNPTAAGVVTT